MSEVIPVLGLLRKTTRCLVCVALLGVAASGCAQDVVLGEHIARASNPQTSAPVEPSSQPSSQSSEQAPTSNADNTSWEPPHSFTRDHRQDTDPDSGRFFDDRDGGPPWPPRPGDMPQFPDPRPAPSEADFPFEPPDEDGTFGASSNFELGSQR